MKKQIKVSEKIDKTKTDIYTYLIKQMLFLPYGQELLLKKFKKKLYSALVEENNKFPEKVQIKKYEFLIAMLESVKRNFKKDCISKNAVNKTINTLVRYGFVKKNIDKKIKEKFKEKHKFYPPSFILFSPTNKCNLSCVGCYASSKINAPTLSYEVVDKIVNEVYNKWGNRFMTISGGEPLMYHSNGKTLFDIWKKYNEMFFMFYTNGTLINKENAKKLAELGNVTPAISVEGFEKETDERRGKGIFKKILKAVDNLKEVGVPFGSSVTVTKKNINILLDDKFYDFIFQELGASYMWMFHLMPIGQANDMKEMMITPEQRVKLYRKWEYLLKEKKYCIADFWNSGVLANGCIAYGRHKGYLYINWNGDITPCAFVPYHEDNILDLHKKGKGITDALFSDLFVNGRKWQCKYGLDNTKKPHNWLMPCPIRDHYQNFKDNILTKKCKPENIYAKKALNSKEYNKTLKEFDEELNELTEPIWKKEYLKKE
jgi:MoaA/NifB/PqqE/SkfB family radical SAM enzyme